MKKGNILIWALSLVIAAVLWGYVAFYENPEDEKTLTNIPVKFVNDTALSSRDLVLVGGRDATVRVRFTGRIQNLINIKNDTVTAVIDLRDIRAAGEIPMQYELQGPADLEFVDINRVTLLVPVTIDRSITRNVNVRLDFAGALADGYTSDPAVFDPLSVRITGPATLLDTISEAVARYEPFEPLTRSVNNVAVDYALYTQSGVLVESEHITADPPDILLSISVSMVKTVPLEIGFIEGGGLLEKHISWSVDPPSVRISGDPDQLAEINSIYIAQIDLAALQGDLTDTYTVRVPDFVRNYDFIDTAKAEIHITSDVKTRSISTININVINLALPEGYTYNYVTRPIDVTLRGPDDELNRVEPNNVRIVADFSDEIILSAGRHRRAGTVYVDGFETVGAIDKGYEVIIEIVPISDDLL